MFEWSIMFSILCGAICLFFIVKNLFWPTYPSIERRRTNIYVMNDRRKRK